MGWFGVLARVMPWGAVIETAPQVLKAAREMLRKRQAETAAAPPAADDAQAMQRLQGGMAAADWQWLQSLVQRVQRLENAQCQSLQLLEKLAEQNTELGAAVQHLCANARYLARTCIVLGGGVLLCLLLILFRTP